MTPRLVLLSITCVMLAWALLPSNPYGYYVVLRVVCCAMFAWATCVFLASNKAEWAWVFGTLAVVYNPIFRLPLGRPLWSAVNVLTIMACVAVMAGDLIETRKNRK